MGCPKQTIGFPIFLILAVGIVHSQFDSSTCGIEKACFLPNDANCYMGCNGMGFSYVFTNETYQYLMIEIFGQSSSQTGFYYAVGFSQDTMMGGDYVIECSALGNASISLKFSYNVQKFENTGEPSNVRITNQDSYSDYFVDPVTKFNDGQVYCSATVKVTGATDPQVFKFDPVKRYYLLMANGPTNSDGLLHHVHDVTTPSALNLVDVHPAFDPNGCGVTKGCFIPTGGECYSPNVPVDVTVSYFMKNTTHLQLELVGSANSSMGNYIAVGFSLDNMMGNESVIECSQYGADPLSVKFSYNDGTPTNTRITGEPEIRKTYIQDQNFYQDGKIFCTATVRVDGSSGNDKIFRYDPKQKYYLLLAKGYTNQDGLLHHYTNCKSSQQFLLDRAEPSFDSTTCGIEKTCFLPTECYLGCNGMGYSFKMTSPTTMDVEMFSVASDLGYYVAVGFSTDAEMGDESVLECSSINRTGYSIKFSYNVGGDDRYNTRIPKEPDVRNQLITNQVVHFADGFLYCSATVNVSGSDVSDQIFAYDPNNNYYLLMASGTTTDSALNKHFDHVVSEKPYDFTTGQEVSVGSTLFNCSACGVSKGCFFPNDPSGCNGYGVSWKYINDTQIEIELTKKGMDGYIAVGFSSDNKMGNDNVVECSNMGSGLSFKFSYNDPSPTNLRITGEEQIEKTYFQGAQYSSADGFVYCKATVNVGGWDGSDLVFKFNKNMSYFLLIAQGSTTATGLLPHTDSAASTLIYNLEKFVGDPAPTNPPLINPDFDCSQCGKTKGCFFPNGPTDCTGIGFAWQYLSPTSINMELMKAEPDGYIAVGFNLNSYMGGANVVECSALTGKPLSWKFSYNDNSPTNVRIPNEETIESTSGTSYFNNTVIKQENGQMYCSAVVNVGGWPSSDQVFKYDSTKNYYLLLAKGPTNDQGLDVHNEKKITQTTINLQATTEIIPSSTVPPTTAPPSINTDFNCSYCGHTKGCFFPNGQNSCTGMGFTYEFLNSTSMLMEIMKDGSTGYVAAGFNMKSEMGGANVIECSQLQNAQLSMKFSYNNGHNNVRISGENSLESAYFKNATYKTENGRMYCRAIVDVSGWSEDSEVFKFDPTQLYYLLVATGDTTASGLSYHGNANRAASQDKVNLTATAAVSGKSGMDPKIRLRLIHAHAVMMILAWICFVPTALLFARFLRGSWALIKPAGIQIWFHVHRTSNIVGLVLMIASFICIMTANSWKWSGPGSSGGKWSSVHTMTGLFALIFAWMQPFISFMRCQPNTPNRPIFNWIHRGVGVVAYILATVALSVAAYHFTPLGTRWNNPTLQLALVIGPIGWFTILILLDLFVSFLQFVLPRLNEVLEKENNHGTIEMLRQVIVLISVGLVVGDAIALSVMVTA